MSETIINKPRGTLDYMGKDKLLYEGIKKILDEEAARFGCQMADVPMFEDEKLFVRGVGQSSDIVTKEMFRLDVKGEHEYVLRPEFTASINRSTIENKLYASPDLPLRISYCGPVFRFERPQTGRLREFTQWGVEFLDSRIDMMTAMDSVLLCYRTAEQLLNRELLLEVNYLGSFQARVKYQEALKAYYQDKLPNMCEDCKRRYETNVLRILDCKVPDDIQINKGAPSIADYIIGDDRIQFNQMLAALKELSVPYKVNDRLVRGLDYYTGLVFELYDPMNMELGAIGAGGQYGSLMQELGGPNFEGIGFSLGVERLILALDQQRKDQIIGAAASPLDYFIIDLREKKDMTPIIVADELRTAGRSVSAASYTKAISGALKMADRLKTKTTIIFDDYNPGQAIIKNMLSREQAIIKSDDPDMVVSYLMKNERNS